MDQRTTEADELARLLDHTASLALVTRALTEVLWSEGGDETRRVVDRLRDHDVLLQTALFDLMGALPGKPSDPDACRALCALITEPREWTLAGKGGAS